jgi:integrase
MTSLTTCAPTLAGASCSHLSKGDRPLRAERVALRSPLFRYPIETFEPDELRAIAEAARSSLHRTRPAHGYSAETNAEWQRINEQDAALFIVAACTGLRLGEFLRPPLVRR